MRFSLTSSSSPWNEVEKIWTVTMWTFILCLTSTAMYQGAGETDILLKRPADGVPWSWHSSKSSHGGAGWNLASSQTAFSVCDITIGSQPTNWLRSNFIDAKDAKMLNVELKYSLLGCPTALKRTFCNYRLSIYVLHVEKELVGVDLNPLTANKVTYQKVETIVPTVLPASEKSKGYDYDGKIITKKGGVYLAFLDQGACVSLSSVIVSYNYCPEIGRVLVRFSRTAAVEKRTGHCTDINSVNKVKLSGVCLSNGEWNITDGIKCLCKPSYELVNATEGNVQECSACLKGFYKSVASNSKCDECPTNSASNTGRTGCLCHEGFYKKPGLHGTPCKALPKAPRNANVTVVKETYVEIMWERSPDESNGQLRYSIDCFRCKSSKYKDCKESCGTRVGYKPNQDNITDGTVAVNGLPSDSFLKFRVYSVSELNEQEKDKDKWNYVTVSAKTNAEDVPTVGGSSSRTKMVIAGAAGGGGLLLLILAITIIIVVFRFKRRRNNIEGHIVPEEDTLPMEELNHLEVVDERNEHDVVNVPERRTNTLSSEELNLVEVEEERNEHDGINVHEYLEIIDSPSFELKREKIKIERLIGSGDFGEVYKATLDNDTVAVKSLKASATAKDKQDMITELIVMKRLKPHPHVLKLVGCCSISD